MHVAATEFSTEYVVPFDARLGRCSLTIRVRRAVQMLNTIHMRKRRKGTIKYNLCVPRENRTCLSEVSFMRTFLPRLLDVRCSTLACLSCARDRP
jgi:hypothetical protein